MYDHRSGPKVVDPSSSLGSAPSRLVVDIKGKALRRPGVRAARRQAPRPRPVVLERMVVRFETVDDFAAPRWSRPRPTANRAFKIYPLATPNGRGGIRHVTRRSVDREFAQFAYEKVEAVRRAVGPDADLMVDLSGGLTTGETIRFCRRLRGARPPLHRGTGRSVRPRRAAEEYAEHIHTPIALGERVYTRYGFRPILESRAADVLQPDIGNTGGISEAKKIAAMAEAYNVQIQPHVCASPVSTAAALQLDACIPNLLIQELYPYRSAEHFMLVDHAPELDVRDGVLDIPDRPGLGVNLVEDRIRPFLWAECASYCCHRPCSMTTRRLRCSSAASSTVAWAWCEVWGAWVCRSIASTQSRRLPPLLEVLPGAAHVGPPSRVGGGGAAVPRGSGSPHRQVGPDRDERHRRHVHRRPRRRAPRVVPLPGGRRRSIRSLCSKQRCTTSPTNTESTPRRRCSRSRAPTSSNTSRLRGSRCC